MSVDRPLSRPLVVVKNAAQPLLYPLARPLVRSALYSTSALTRFAVNGVEAALALDFIGSEYRTANTSTTFADAFMGNSPRLTYNPGSASSSQSTMTNSSGHLVWAPHNLLEYSEDFSNAAWLKVGTVAIDSTLVTGPDGTPSGRRVLNLNAASGDRLASTVSVTNTTITGSFWVKGDGANIGKDVLMYVKRSGGTFAGSANVTHTLTSEWVRLDATFTQLPDNTGAIVVLGSPSTNSASEVLIYGAHLYRSDLGGMAPVPGAVGDFQYYVPTNGAAEYLPRVGHHVYNGSAWVNEGLLIESEVRTNLILDSNDPTTANWTTKTTTASQNLTGPDGVANSAWTLEDSDSGAYKINRADITIPAAAATYLASLYVLKDSDETRFPEFQVQLNGGSSERHFIRINTATGATSTAQGGGSHINVEDCGNWWRVSFDITNNGANTELSFKILPAGGLNLAGQGSATATGSIGFYGAQLEAGEAIPNTNPVQYKDAPTPSSYIPTNGSTVTRGGQSLTVPANWYDADNPTYTSEELVDEASDLVPETYPDTWTIGIGSASSDGTQAGRADLIIKPDGASLPVGVYVLSFDVTSGSTSNGVWQNNVGYITSGLSVGSYSVVLNQSSDVKFFVYPGEAISLDNISVRQVSAPQFGWPEPEYIGPNLVDNSDFSLGDNGDWTPGGGWSIDAENGVALITSAGNLTQGDFVPSVRGKVMMVSYDIVSPMSGSVAPYFQQIAPTVDTKYGTYRNAVGSYVDYFVVPSNALYFGFNTNATAGSIDNISVREINPLSVSIQMDGRMTYADEDVPQSNLGGQGNAVWYLWKKDVSNYAEAILKTSGSRTGQAFFHQEVVNVEDFSAGPDDTYTPGINVPFNISSRHGSNFIRGATDGVLTNLDTTPKALPDLSGTDLEIAQDFMGTIGQFRQFAGDIGDTGLVTATNPSTEPTLSLTFDGTEGSFYNLSWSE